MAIGFSDAEAMIAACEKPGVQYATAFDQRFQARHLKLKSLIDNGTFGRDFGGEDSLRLLAAE